jgi:urea transport system permease protein
MRMQVLSDSFCNLFCNLFCNSFRAALACCLLMQSAAALDASLLKPLAGDDPEQRIEAVAAIALVANDDAAMLLHAIIDDRLYASGDGQIYIAIQDQEDQAYHPASGKTAPMPSDADAITVNNRLRSAAQDALAGLKLFSPDRAERMAAALELRTGANPTNSAQILLIRKALTSESDPAIAALLRMSQAAADLRAPSPATRRAALRVLADSSNASLIPLLRAMQEKDVSGQANEPDQAVRIEAVATLAAINARLARTELIGKLFYGLSLGSVLLLAALGLAITFGLMGIINMAHGELLMIGAYTTYVCQLLFRQYLPGALDAYLLAALPAAFIVTASVGMLLERTVIRWLYGRPLETLLCTWGISLMLMQTVRMIFGAQNVEVANPSWMSGGVTVLGSLVLSYNRIVIIVFAFAVVLAVWLILNKTRMGLFVRAVTQNRRMADCVGVPTGRIDMLTFGLGSGIAGLGGVALSQLGNVGPDLGQSYIVDSFMVVVLGGVGQLAGTIIAAIGLGEVNKFLEPVAGAVLAKIAILVFIIIFIQRRPQGLFAMKGRSAE